MNPSVNFTFDEIIFIQRAVFVSTHPRTIWKAKPPPIFSPFLTRHLINPLPWPLAIWYIPIFASDWHNELLSHTRQRWENPIRYLALSQAIWYCTVLCAARYICTYANRFPCTPVNHHCKLILSLQTITCDCEATPALQLKAFCQRGDKLETSHYRVNVNRFRARLNVVCITEKLLVDLKCDGWPEVCVNSNSSTLYSVVKKMSK